jgi:glycosyltransferase involved in cell wall biosynthesis
MKKTIYIIDFIGIHSGMQYYDDAFAGELSRIPDVNVIVLSNYATKPLEKSFFKNFFVTGKLKGILRLLQGYLSLFGLIISKRKARFIYLAYGGYIDILLMTLTAFSRKITIDVHEVYALDFFNNQFIRQSFQLLYRYLVKSVIVHSERSMQLLHQINYKGKIFEVPHFKYSFNKAYDEKNVDIRILNDIKTNRINILFFGHIRHSKGIDILIEAFNSLSNDTQNKLHLIVAGNDTDNILHQMDIQDNENVSIFARYIRDDELTFLFSKVDYVVLPYREVSQSGILEMAFYFRKPILASRISYFEQVLNEYPSFGHLFDITEKDLANVISSLPFSEQKFYNENDIKNFEQRDKIKSFMSDFSKII